MNGDMIARDYIENLSGYNSG